MSSLRPLKSIREGDNISPSLIFQPVNFKKNHLKILDQTQLPERIVYRKLRNYREVAKAIKTLRVRGAPLIGITAAFGMALTAQNCLNSLKLTRNCLRQLSRAAKTLKQARPTAVNLTWAIKRIERILAKKLQPVQMLNAIIKEAKKTYQEEEDRSLAMGQVGAKLIKKNYQILTICNAGKLAAPGLGTALAPIYIAFAQKKNPLVFACETRPLLQGARLTTFELRQAGIQTILITDNMVGTIASQIDIFLVGADRIAANGDTANKIGTLSLAIIARHFKKPFYVAAPVSTFDFTKPNGNSIPIELRDEQEIKTIRGKEIAPKGIKVYNPAFDITPNNLITGFITDKGIIYPPYRKSLKKLLI